MPVANVMQPSSASSPGESTFDLTSLMRLVRGRARLIGGMFLGVLAVTLYIAVTAPTLYTATTSLVVDQPKDTVISPTDTAANDGAPDTGLVDTEVDQMHSPSLAQAVANHLQLDSDPEFNPALRPRTFMSNLRARIQSLTHHTASNAKAPSDPVVDSLLNDLKATRVGTSYLVTISFKSKSPVKAANIANTFAEVFLSAQRDAKVAAAQQSSGWLNDRLGALQAQVESADAALQQYKIANNLMSAQGTTLTEQEVSGLDQQEALARAGEAEAEARLNTAKAQLAQGSTGQDVGEALSSTVVQELRQKRAEISQQVADLQGRYGPLHPDLLKAKRELADIDGQIQSEVQRVISNLDAQAQIARQRTSSLESSIGASRGVLADNSRATVRLDELQRNADAAQSLYETFLSKYKELTAEAGLQSPDAHITSLATPPNGPSDPKRSLIVAFGVLLGLSCGFGSALIAEQLYNGLNDGEAVEHGLGRTYLGTVPLLASTLEGRDRAKADTEPFDYILAKPLSSFAESFRNLNTALSFSRTDMTPKVVAITSSLPGEGKTTTSICMARIAAMSGHRTVVVDCDLRQHAVDRMLPAQAEVGLIELLNGEATLDEVMVRDQASGAMIIPLAKTAQAPIREIFSTQEMSELIATLRERFDLVVLDTPPVILVTDTRVVVRHADAVLLLVRWRQTPRRLVRTSLRLLDATSSPAAGIALTRVDLKRTANVDPSDPTSYYRTYMKYYSS